MKKFFGKLAVVLVFIFIAYLIFIYGSFRWQKSTELVNRKQITFRVDSTFNSVERKAIKNALQRWMDKTHNNVAITMFVDDITVFDMLYWGSDKFATIYNAEPWWSWKNHIAVRFAGLSARGVAMIFSGDLFIMCDNKAFEDIVVHEIGHILINVDWHSGDDRSIMYYSVGAPGSRRIMQQEIDMIMKTK